MKLCCLCGIISVYFSHDCAVVVYFGEEYWTDIQQIFWWGTHAATNVLVKRAFCYLHPKRCEYRGWVENIYNAFYEQGKYKGSNLDTIGLSMRTPFKLFLPNLVELDRKAPVKRLHKFIQKLHQQRAMRVARQRKVDGSFFIVYLVECVRISSI